MRALSAFYKGFWRGSPARVLAEFATTEKDRPVLGCQAPKLKAPGAFQQKA